MDNIRDWLEKHLFPNGVSYYFIPSCYTFGGLILFIAIPSYIFTVMEGTKTVKNHLSEPIDLFQIGRCWTRFTTHLFRFQRSALAILSLQWSLRTNTQHMCATTLPDTGP
jgi:hypothetical protein